MTDLTIGSAGFPLPSKRERTPQERFNMHVRYALNPPANVTKEVVDKLLGLMRKDAELHPEWLDELPEPQQASLRGMLRSPPR